MTPFPTIVKDRVIYCPSLNFAGQVWSGVSKLVLLFSIPLKDTFSLSVPITLQSDTFVPVITWRNGDDIVSYKLWSTGFESLDYPLYNGEMIPVGAFIKVYTVSNKTTILVGEWFFPLDYITPPAIQTDGNIPVATVQMCTVSGTTLDEMFRTCA